MNLINPESDRLIVRGVGLVDTRAQLLNVEKAISGDRYLFVRDAFLQRRQYLINDGVIEEDPFLDEFNDFEEDLGEDPEAGSDGEPF